MLKFGKVEISGFGGLFVTVIAVMGVVSVAENGIIAAVKWRRIRGIEKLAAMANSREGVEEAAEALAEDGKNTPDE